MPSSAYRCRFQVSEKNPRSSSKRRGVTSLTSFQSAAVSAIGARLRLGHGRPDRADEFLLRRLGSIPGGFHHGRECLVLPARPIIEAAPGDGWPGKKLNE